MAKTRGKIIAILFFYIMVSFAFWLLSDQIGEWAVTANPVLVTIVNLVTNPFYLGSIILMIQLFISGLGLNKTFFNYFRVTLASIIMSLGIDIITILHAWTLNFTITDGSAVSLYFDTVLGKVIQPTFQSNPMLGTFILYVVIPLVFALFALLIASPKAFVNLIRGEVGLGNGNSPNQ